MNRTVWFLAGAGTTAYAMVKARRAKAVLTREGARDQLDGLRAGLDVFRSEYAAGAAEAESHLRQRLALPPQPREIGQRT